MFPKTLSGTVVFPRLPAVPRGVAGPEPAEQVEPARIALWRQVLLFAVPATLTFLIGRQDIGVRQMWNDEHATWHAATLSWGDLFHLLDHIDRVLTLYYVAMHGWVSLVGDSPTMLRLPALVAMACAAGFTALVGQRLLDTPAGLIAGLIFAILPATSRYAQEARPYALAVAAATLATLLLLVALNRPRWPYWLWYAASVAATAFLHLVAVVVLAAHALLVWFRYQRSERDVRLWKSLGALALILALVMPLGYAGSDQAGAIEWIKADKAAVLELPVKLFGSYAVAAAVCGMGLVGALMLAFARRRRVAFALLAWALVPPLFTYVTFPLLHLFLYRYLLFTLPAWALLAAGGCYGMARLAFRRSWPQLLIAAVALPALALLALPPQHAARERIVPDEPDYRAAAHMIRSEMRPGDGMVFAGTARPPRMGMAYEMRHTTPPADVLLAASSAELGTYGAAECRVTVTCLGQRQRIWLVSTSFGDGPWSEMPREKASALSRTFRVASDARFQRIHVYLLVRRPAS
ncbi:MAG TPA: glycosyltransferase family 39 protein [Micromonosporaceae bacterium]